MQASGRIQEPGELVKVEYKSGRYIGRVVETDGRRMVVSILAVLKHPEQGNLHRRFDPDVPLFHERRALAYTEKASVPVEDAQPYAGEVPEYKASLKRALEAELAALDRMKRWAERGLEQLKGLQRDYGF
ncbi:sporulation phosphorelay system protein KapB [Paenibacillus cisolokensis]|jgi:kinase-associated protein B|uniref:sporulation phosphorelay system protein KapB n=1 Tax=Paenibacillus cisolokensis TaxID=1658519 RepID=UPI003D2C7441